MTTSTPPSQAPAKQAQQFRIPQDSLWAQAWKVAAALSLVGIIASLLGFISDPKRFAFSYLFAFIVVVSIALGSLFFVLIQHLSAAGWSASVRRSAEVFLAGSPILALLVLPLLANVSHLYEWTHTADDSHHTEAHAEQAPAPQHQEGHHAQQGEHKDKAHSPMEAALHHKLLAHKQGYLNTPFFLVRAVFYVAMWILWSLLYFRWSLRQDKDGDPKYTRWMQSRSPLALSVFGVTLTFAAFDWLMSLEPAWYSTIFGVYFFAASVVATLAMLIVFTMQLNASGVLGNIVNVEHYHDLGKLLFAFICFWAYIGLSQLLLIWYAGIPEEATYYHHRWDSQGWRAVSLFLFVGHFAAPFFFLISRMVKRRLTLLKYGASWMLFVHMVDMYWFVMPYADAHGFSLHWLDIACLMAVVGAYLAFVFYRMLGIPLIAVGDPRLHRAINFHNA